MKILSCFTALSLVFVGLASGADKANLLPVQIRGLPKSVNAEIVQAPTALLDPLTMEFTFGRKISQRCLGIQVTVTNNDNQHDLIVHEITLSVAQPNGKPGAPSEDQDDSDQPMASYQVSSLDKTVLQGIMERGQYTDPRNMLLRVFRAVGVVAGGVPTFAHVGHSFAPAVAVFSGGFIDGYTGIFPDYTVNQLVRLGDAAFDTNKVVTKGTSAKVEAFVPLSILLSQEDIKTYRKDPHTFWTKIGSSYQMMVDVSMVQPLPGS